MGVTQSRHVLPEAVLEGEVMTVRMPHAARQLAQAFLVLVSVVASFYSAALLGLCVLFSTVGEAAPGAFVALAVFAVVAPAPVAGAYLYRRRMRYELVIDRAAGIARHRDGVASIADATVVRVRRESGRCRVELVGSTGETLAVATQAFPGRFGADALRLASMVGAFIDRPVESVL